MSFLLFNRFKGEIPRLPIRQLPPGNAQVAENCNLDSGELRPLRLNTFEETPTKVGVKLTIFLWKSYWLHFTTDVDVALGPIVSDTTDRFYYTGDGVPKMSFSTIAESSGTDYPVASYTLGIPDPVSACTATEVANTGTITGATQANPVVITDVAHGLITGKLALLASIGGMVELNNRTFTITWLTDDTYSLNNEDGTGHTAYTTGGTRTQAYDIADLRERIYVYTYVSNQVEEGQPSPVSNTVVVGPDQQVDLSGLDVGVGGSYDLGDKSIYRAENGGDFQYVGTVTLATTVFSDTVLESDLGENLPVDDRIAPPTDMAGIIMLPNGVAAGFSGKELHLAEPYQPHAWPYYVVSDYDIVAIANIGTDIIVATTGTLYTVSGVDPATAVLDKVELQASCVAKRSMVDMGTYALFATPVGLAAIGPGLSEIITRPLFDPEDWAALDPTTMEAYYWRGRYVCFYDDGSTQAGFIFDPRPGEEKLVFIDDYATAGFHKKVGGDLYLQIGSDIELFNGGANRTYTWRSPKIRKTARNYSVGKVEADAYPVTLKLYADDVLKHTETVADKNPFRMDGDYQGDEWEVESSGSNTVTKIIVATSMDELKRALER